MYTQEDYKAMKKASPRELQNGWKEITRKEYWYYLEVVVPTKMSGKAFLVGEPCVHSQHESMPGEPIHEAVTEVNGRYFMRPAPVKDFDPKQYEAEIIVRFFRMN